jgi:hypothetical protein
MRMGEGSAAAHVEEGNDAIEECDDEAEVDDDDDDDDDDKDG